METQNATIQSTPAQAGRTFKQITTILLVVLPLLLLLTTTYRIGYNNGYQEGGEEAYEKVYQDMFKAFLERGISPGEASYRAKMAIYEIKN